MPNGGDAAVRAAQQRGRSSGFSSSMIAKAATLGSPMTSASLGGTIYG